MFGRLALAMVVSAVLGTGGAEAASCGKTGAGFSTWLAAFQREAAAAGVSQKVLVSALSGVTYDASVIKLDRNQGHFKQSFETYYAKRGRPLEARYGVPGSVLVAIWGLETGFGANVGSKPSIRSLATLAYDCRRSAFFKNELIAALKVIQRGDLSASQMRGAWAGELGQTQFLASSYLKFAVDFDGDGRRDLIRSKADALASTANYLKAYGWKSGQPASANIGALAGWNKASVYQKTIATLADRAR